MEPSKFSDDAVVRFIFAPIMVLIGCLFLSNYKRFIEYAYSKSQGVMPGTGIVLMFRIGGAFWVGAALTLLFGIW